MGTTPKAGRSSQKRRRRRRTTDVAKEPIDESEEEVARGDHLSSSTDTQT